MTKLVIGLLTLGAATLIYLGVPPLAACIAQVAASIGYLTTRGQP